jgi:hypothetical protein
VDGILTALRSPKSVCLLSRLVGIFCIIASFFWLPLYASPADVGGNDTLTGWGFSQEMVKNMLAQHNTIGFILPISLTFLPVVAALILGILAIVRVVTLSPVLAKFFVGVYVLGSMPLLLLLIVVGPHGLLRLGYFGGILGYVLFLAGDLALRRAAAHSTPS